MKFIHNFVKPFAQMLLCSESLEDSPEYYIMDIDFYEIKELEENLDSCVSMKSIDAIRCANVCKHDIFSFTPAFNML